MATKTLEELRALARSRGMKGYSKLTRDELEQRLAKNENQKPDAKHKLKKTARKQKPSQAKSKSARSAAKPAPLGGKKKAAASGTRATKRVVTPPAPATERVSQAPRLSSEEERVENAKYATVLPGNVAPPAVAADLGEDIDKLPPVTEPTLCLLPQKPGVLHGYWAVPPGAVPHPKSLKLRLGRIAGDTFEILEEIPLLQERGHWYFHLDESADVGAVYLQLGYYETSGRFVTATRRGIARIPGLYASEHTDRLWWVSEEQFRTMYLRAGGFARGARLGWAASIGSPGGAPGQIPERLAWPGGISSR